MCETKPLMVSGQRSVASGQRRSAGEANAPNEPTGEGLRNEHGRCDHAPNEATGDSENFTNEPTDDSASLVFNSLLVWFCEPNMEVPLKTNEPTVRPWSVVLCTLTAGTGGSESGVNEMRRTYLSGMDRGLRTEGVATFDETNPTIRLPPRVRRA
jgi:hypothetical protein